MLDLPKPNKVRYILTRQSDGSLIRKATKQSFYKKTEEQYVN